MGRVSASSSARAESRSDRGGREASVARICACVGVSDCAEAACQPWWRSTSEIRAKPEAMRWESAGEGEIITSPGYKADPGPLSRLRVRGA